MGGAYDFERSKVVGISAGSFKVGDSDPETVQHDLGKHVLYAGKPHVRLCAGGAQ
jgi:hypothetical protein